MALDERIQKLRLVSTGAKRSPAERKKLHAELARTADLAGKIAEANADYKQALAGGELRRAAPPKRNRGTRSN